MRYNLRMLACVHERRSVWVIAKIKGKGLESEGSFESSRDCGRVWEV